MSATLITSKARNLELRGLLYELLHSLNKEEKDRDIDDRDVILLLAQILESISEIFCKKDTA